MYTKFNEVGRPPALATVHRPRPSPMIEPPAHRPRQVYLEYFPDPATRPARACFGGNQLPFGATVEVQCTTFV